MIDFVSFLPLYDITEETWERLSDGFGVTFLQ
jgi:hypothetical protein